MVVQHNLTAMNSNRMLGLTTKTQAKATEKLSSGYKINRAADDAAGLAISEKMRKQIRGLTQASLNAQDGISAVQTAEGALNEVQDMLQRMNELAIKSANGTQSYSDRTAIQAEVDQLAIEIDRVSTTTKFNETYLLKGVDTDKGYSLKFTKASGAKSTWTGGIGTFGKKTDGVYTASVSSTISKAITATYVNAAGSGVQVKINQGYSYTFNATEAKRMGISSKVSVIVWAKGGSNVTQAGINKAFTAGTKLVFATKDQFLMALKSAMRAKDNQGNIKEVTFDDADKKFIVEAFADKNNDLNFSLHVGADSVDSNKISLNISMMSARGLGVNALNVGGQNANSATDAIDTIAAALQTVSNQRAMLGAVQNRLEHTINNLDNIVENTTSAESSIRDTDMATQMVAYSNNNILAQAGQAMLAQSNQSNPGVLSVLG